MTNTSIFDRIVAEVPERSVDDFHPLPTPRRRVDRGTVGLLAYEMARVAFLVALVLGALALMAGALALGGLIAKVVCFPPEGVAQVERMEVGQSVMWD